MHQLSYQQIKKKPELIYLTQLHMQLFVIQCMMYQTGSDIIPELEVASQPEKKDLALPFCQMAWYGAP